MNNVALLLATLCSVGCVAQNDPRLKKADEVATAVDSLKAKLDELETQVLGLQTDVIVLQGGVNPYETAVFDPGSPGAILELIRAAVRSWSPLRTLCHMSTAFVLRATLAIPLR